ncbi:hypothetical protein NQ117_08650 [Paenibacillus sp. SC116]|uniref:hypothetical protein n=1 Tax=Paenibacillus sp. SC116 TaxID=2968986 RepID=UPI00215A1533|nr:hypothetical protein [Paenibacillus sp. SC116]MCR8843755.1 hypothetical protein [Paenibacillus sp. SC116]
MKKFQRIVVLMMISILSMPVLLGHANASNVDYLYDNAGRLVQMNDTQLLYDNNGNMTKKSGVMSYTASKAFSKIQGKSNWYYQEWDGKNYKDVAWSNDQGLWKGSNRWLMLTATYQHPDGSDAVRKWIAPRSGTVTITGKVAKLDGQIHGDGVRVSIMKNNSPIWPSSGWKFIEYNDTKGVNVSVTTEVKEGDALYFIVNQNKTFDYDGTYWDPTITYLPLSYRASNDFSSIQSMNNWYFQEWDGQKYADITWNTALNHWQGNSQWLRIGTDFQHPDGSDSVRKWIAPRSGAIEITGKVAKSDGQTLGDGVRVKVMRNNGQIWPSSGWQVIEHDDTKGVQVSVTAKVAKGDALYFIVNQNKTIDYDGTYWDPKINYISLSQKASEGYSIVQGKNNWSYQEWDGKQYKNIAWDSFLNQWKGSNKWLRVTKNSQHPDESDSVRKWIAPRGGKIDISGKVAKLKGEIQGDGVRVKIMKNSNQIWPATDWQVIEHDDTQGVNVSVTTEVAKGDALYFIVNQNKTIDYDGTYWDPTISYVPLTYKASAGFAKIQGEGNWQYQEWDGINYKNMTWNDDWRMWKGSQEWLSVSGDSQHPAANDSVRKWTSSKSGSISITGKVSKAEGQILGDGVRVKIMKNNSQIWPATGWKVIAHDDTKGLNVSLTTEVEKGDAIYFIVNQNETIDYDLTYWDPMIHFVPHISVK